MNKARIDELRRAIDDIDSEMVRLFVKRLECSVAIGLEKNMDHVPMYDQERERQILERIVTLLPTDEYEKEVLELYENLLRISKASQVRHL